MGALHRMVAAAALVAAAATATAVAPAGAEAAVPAVPPVPPVRAVVATYNIHAGAGSDNVYDLDRTAAAIRALDADVVGLEEADVHWGERSRFDDTVAELGRRLGMRTAFAPIYSLDPLTAGAPRREFGVALLSRHPIVAVENHDLTRLSTQDPNPVPAPAPGFLEATVQIGGARAARLRHPPRLPRRPDRPPPPGRRHRGDPRRGPARRRPGAPRRPQRRRRSTRAGRPAGTRLRDGWAVAPTRDGEPGTQLPRDRPDQAHRPRRRLPRHRRRARQHRP